MERIGVAFTGGGMSPPEVVQCVQLAEELGYESAWVAEGHGGDQFSILTACALATSRIQLGTSISSVFVRSAPTIAMAAACATIIHKADLSSVWAAATRCRWGRSTGWNLPRPSHESAIPWTSSAVC